MILSNYLINPRVFLDDSRAEKVILSDFESQSPDPWFSKPRLNVIDGQKSTLSPDNRYYKLLNFKPLPGLDLIEYTFMSYDVIRFDIADLEEMRRGYRGMNSLASRAAINSYRESIHSFFAKRPYNPYRRVITKDHFYFLRKYLGSKKTDYTYLPKKYEDAFYLESSEKIFTYVGKIEFFDTRDISKESYEKFRGALDMHTSEGGELTLADKIGALTEHNDDG